MRRVVVTGLGIVSCIGNTKDEVVNNLKKLRSGIIKAPEYKEFSFRSLVHGKPNINLEENIPRCSYKFCKFKDSCSYNYNSKSKNVCYQDHYVHNMVSSDINILILYIKSRKNFDRQYLSHNKEILKSINTLSYVISHMENELKTKCLYLDKKEWDKFHINKKSK